MAYLAATALGIACLVAWQLSKKAARPKGPQTTAQRPAILNATSERVPKPTAEDVDWILRRDHPANLYDAAARELMCYRRGRACRESPHRVRLAILRLSDGRIDQISHFVKVAKRDFRDVIAPAEYPRFWKLGFVGVGKLSIAEQSQLKEDDWRDYQTWFLRKEGPNGPKADGEA